jgi:hypothetical protein
MDKKKYPEDLRGFEEFIESQPNDSSFLPKLPKKEVSFEHFTFLTNDSDRLLKIKNLMTQKVPFANKFEQGEKLLIDQQNEIKVMKTRLFELCDTKGSPYQRSLSEIFDAFFQPPKT